MVLNMLPSLKNMCATSFVYFLWSRRDFHEQAYDENHWLLLESRVTADVEGLPLPKSSKRFLLSFVKPAGAHLFSFLNVWLQKTHRLESEKWLSGGVLSECLSLYAIGLINQRKTAEKLLRRWVLSNVNAFRLACVNNLEMEVLALWPHVKQYFLRKIVLERHRVTATLSFRSHKFYLQEPDEVLFWIGYCISKENWIDLNSIPHYAEYVSDWYHHSVLLARRSGDVTFFECIKNCFDAHLFYNHADVIAFNCLPATLMSFFYHFQSLNDDGKKAVFLNSSKLVLSYFLQWPLSLVFLEQISSVWDFIVDQGVKEWLIIIILQILRSKFLCHDSEFQVSDVHCRDQLEGIWVATWEVCPDSFKEQFMSSFVFVSNSKFSALKDHLRHFFISNGEAILNYLMGDENMEEELKNIISKNFPKLKYHYRMALLPSPLRRQHGIVKGFSDFQRRKLFISEQSELFKDPIVQTALRAGRKMSNYLASLPRKREFDVSGIVTVVCEKFVDFVFKLLLRSNNNDNS